MARHSRPRRTAHTWRYSRYLMIALFALLGACSTPPTNTVPTAIPLTTRHALTDQQFTLQGGTAILIDRDAKDSSANEPLMVRFEAVSSDSRCPTKVVCEEAGDATVIVVAQLGTQDPVRLELHTSPPMQRATIAYGRYPVHLLALDPLREQPEDTLELDQYTAQLLVRPELPPPPEPPLAPPVDIQAHRPVLGEQFSVQGGETIYVDTPDDPHAAKIELRFAEIVNDSRCPRLVECVVAGDATILLVASFGTTQDSLSLHTTPPLNKDPVLFDSYEVRLIALDPIRDRPEDTLQLNQYTAQLVVTYRGAAPIPTLTPMPSPQASVQNLGNTLNACSLVSIDTITDQYGQIAGEPQPQTNANDGSQECSIPTARGMITIRFLLGDQATADALVAQLQKSGIPLAALAKDTLGRTAFGQNQQQAMLVTQADSAIFVFGITFSDQAQPADRKEARYNLDTLQSLALARYFAGQVEQLPKP